MRIKKYEDIPEGKHTKPVWRAKGYKPKKYAVAELYSFWNGMYYVNLKVFTIDQVEEIRGIKARLRRTKLV